jgi:putative toxin-antitoxin system antitoxin component (TIGR02293 family)
MSKSFDILEEPGLSYYAVADQDLVQLIDAIREGIKFTTFEAILRQYPFSLNEWSDFLLLSARTMHRYKKERATFDQSSSEKILEIILLYRYGVQVFKEHEKFESWLSTSNLALGGKRPKDFLDCSFGINLLRDELLRTEQGLLA